MLSTPGVVGGLEFFLSILDGGNCKHIIMGCIMCDLFLNAVFSLDTTDLMAEKHRTHCILVPVDHFPRVQLHVTRKFPSVTPLIVYY